MVVLTSLNVVIGIVFSTPLSVVIVVVGMVVSIPLRVVIVVGMVVSTPLNDVIGIVTSCIAVVVIEKLEKKKEIQAHQWEDYN